ncbi:putative protein BIC [Helianthus annuus]|uniref:Uncharacterized protein n=1 Tax=Helianthus annuus TaxID=4232 RepID=A0A251VGT0_HELAN|nr:putative protein BIC [Helianthus annuus]KAJ0560332.1 putative protein BIC [Helianthus annuus]KAJ0566626.1 putative protein BIC [Helianthus annuus]KAJ0573348.1 putative protein BIC [Helianthus annuus]KAJ0737744.1 putative protein BIC [Helianthus annuus]
MHLQTSNTNSYHIEHQDLIISMDTHKNPISLTSPQDFKNLQEDGTTPSSMMVEESGRERLKRHRVEMSGRVWIPDIWGQEDLLKNYIDCTVFDSCLEKSSIMSAREALIQEGRSTMRIENRC